MSDRNKDRKYSDSKARENVNVNFKSDGNADIKKCGIYKKCGGCQFLHMNYGAQLGKKKKYLEALLGEYVKDIPVIGMEQPYYYRNKVVATFHRKKNGEIIAGIYEEGTHNVLPADNCLIENKEAQKIIETIKNLVKSFKITVHNEDTGYGLLKHVLIRVGEKTGEIMVVLVTSDPMFPSKKNFTKELLKKHKNITTVVQNINDRHTTMVLGTRNQVLYGKGYIEDVLCGKRFRISPNSFYQVNPVQTEILYSKAMEYAHLTGKERVIDAYCGTGTIGIVASDKAGEVIGVELNKAAISDAVINAKMNNAKNVRFYSNDATRFITNMTKQGEKSDVVFMDPPRSGSTKEFIDSVIKLNPNRVVYVSCGPDTLARDIKMFTRSGRYRVEKITGVDMFPWTEHMETVVLMSKVNTVKG